jgi:hypothetical protein
MTTKHTKGETHGCIVCGKPYQLYVVCDVQGKFIDAKLMSAGGKLVPNPTRPLVACENHADEQVEIAVAKVYGPHINGDNEE